MYRIKCVTARNASSSAVVDDDVRTRIIAELMKDAFQELTATSKNNHHPIASEDIYIFTAQRT